MSKLHYTASGIITLIGGRLVIVKQKFCASCWLITEININPVQYLFVYIFINLEALMNNGQLQWQHRYLNTSETLQNKNRNRRE